jgi:hypothetical protein
LRCVHCGRDNPDGDRFCSGCGQVLGAAGAVAIQPGATVGQSMGGLGAWLNQLKEQWKKSWPLKILTAVLLIYALLTQNPATILIGIGVGLAMRYLGERLDGPLAPFWPVRDMAPRPIRVVLAFLVPMFIAWQITMTPTIFQRLTFLPYVGPDASVFACITALCALIATLLVRERTKRPIP